MPIEIEQIPIFEKWEGDYLNYRRSYPYMNIVKDLANDSQKMTPMNCLPISKNGPWIAGGAARKLFYGQELDTDIDLFFKDAIQYSLYEARLKELAGKAYSYTEKVIFSGRTRYASNFIVGNKKVQLINFQFHENIEKLFESFDFTICHFACDGENFYYTNAAIDDEENKRIRLAETIRPASCMRRIIKYAKQGYNMEINQIREFFKTIQNRDLEEDDRILSNYFESDVTWSGTISDLQLEEICRSAGIDPKTIDICSDSYSSSLLITFYTPEDKNLFKLNATLLYPDIQEKKYE